MKIYIDITSLLESDYLSGIQRVVIEYTLRLLRKAELEVCLFSCASDGKTLRVISNKAFEAFYTHKSKNKQKCFTRTTFELHDMERGAIYLELDSTWILPMSRSIFLRKLKQQGITIVSFIHDIIPISTPHFTDMIHQFAPYAVAHLAYSDLILCSTDFTVEQIKGLSDQYGIPHTRYGTVPLGSDFQVKSRDAAIKPQKEAFNITNSGKKYILTVGTLEPRKNHEVLLDAYDCGLRELGVQLVFVGRKGWNTDDLISRMHSHPDYNKNIFHLEGMNDDSVAWLYNHAFLSAFPTRIEGFGLPVVEALEHRVPTIVSDVPVMHEVGGEYCDYFDPDDPEEFVKIVEKYCRDEKLYAARKEMTAEFHPFTWDEAVELLCGYLKQAESKGPQPAAAARIDVSRVIEQIKSDAEKQISFNDIPEMSDINLDEKLARLETEEVHFYRELSSYHGLISRPVIFIKRVIRKLVRFLLEPIVQEINSYNRCVMSIFYDQQEINRTVYELREKVDWLSEQNRQLKKELGKEPESEDEVTK